MPCYSFKCVLAVLICLQLTISDVDSSVASNAVEGFRSKVDERIIGGISIPITEAPWQVSVRLIELDRILYGYGHICGGSVITPRVIVSAAHCTVNSQVTPIVRRNANEYRLVMGASDIYIRTAYTLEYNVLEIVVNPEFNFTTLQNDIALFFINGYIPPNYPTVAVIPLNNNSIAAGTLCSITGWGSTGSGVLSPLLMYATVPIVSYEVCTMNYGSSIMAGMICAGYMQTGGVDSCQGDSGGPMVYNSTLVGVVSWGYGCAQSGYPGVYTNVSYFHNWILEGNATFNYSYYTGGVASMKIFELNKLSAMLLTFILSLILNT